MCRIGDERADAYSVDRPVARKAHRCGECGRTILPGELYERHWMAFEGTSSTHVVCTHCSVLAQWLLIECGGTVTGELIEDIEEHALEYDRPDLQSLASCARLQWRCIATGARFPGIPTPTLPPKLAGVGKEPPR